jgi:hypothetical protein
MLDHLATQALLYLLQISEIKELTDETICLFDILDTKRPIDLVKD